MRAQNKDSTVSRCVYQNAECLLSCGWDQANLLPFAWNLCFKFHPHLLFATWGLWSFTLVSPLLRVFEIVIMYMHVCLCEGICTWLQLSGEARRKQWMFWNWSYRYLWVPNVGAGTWSLECPPQKTSVILTAHGVSTGVWPPISRLSLCSLDLAFYYLKLHCRISGQGRPLPSLQ